jgi:hypothetical protein
MDNRDYKDKEKIIRRMIDSIIIPQYPEIQDVIIDSSLFRVIQSHNILLIADGLDEMTKRKIRDEIETLYKMATLGSENITGPRDFIEVHFG